MIRPTEIVQHYLDAFFGKKHLGSMEAVLAENLIFNGPMQHTTNAKTYIKSLKENPPVNVSYELEENYENGNTVCLVYQFIKPGIKTRMVQIFEVHDEVIVKINLFFDPELFI